MLAKDEASLKSANEKQTLDADEVAAVVLLKENWPHRRRGRRGRSSRAMGRPTGRATGRAVGTADGWGNSEKKKKGKRRRKSRGCKREKEINTKKEKKKAACWQSRTKNNCCGWLNSVKTARQEMTVNSLTVGTLSITVGTEDWSNSLLDRFGWMVTAPVPIPIRYGISVEGLKASL